MKAEDLSPTMRAALKMLKGVMQQIINGECTPEEVAETMAAVETMKGAYRREDDYVTIDEGMRLLGFGSNRVGFCNLMKEQGIRNEKFNNVHIGYNKRKLLALKAKMNDDYQKRRAKLDKKKRMRFYEPN